jgi:hypothetical protein
MQYELVSRALAYVSCFSTLSLLMTSVAIAAINVGKARPLLACAPNACTTAVRVASIERSSVLTGRSHVDAAAAKLWPAKS